MNSANSAQATSMPSSTRPNTAILWRRNFHHISCHWLARSGRRSFLLRFLRAMTGAPEPSITAIGSLQPDAWIEKDEQHVRDERADDGQRAEDENHGACEQHVLVEQRVEEQGPRVGQREHEADDGRAG